MDSGNTGSQLIDAVQQTMDGINYMNMPRATFCNPQVASFGYTEEQAREKFADREIKVATCAATAISHRPHLARQYPHDSTAELE